MDTNPVNNVLNRNIPTDVDFPRMMKSLSVENVQGVKHFATNNERRPRKASIITLMAFLRPGTSPHGQFQGRTKMENL